ncbi:MAG: UDP-3-O-(3-hydroxymyristoyl)glucosamine N-acyltransferase [Candidatus Margulisbacteria bacterium]|nr:UDP-3-O-(3-hydroxymyristoyl)glucosamine N-acyltransferase [Candidatus Margulisiibacteriota bacterium]
MKLKSLAKTAGGEVSGSGSIEIKGVSFPTEAKSGDLVFVLEEKLLAEALASKASAVVINRRLNPKGKPAILVDNPRLAMAKILPSMVKGLLPKKGTHKTAIVPSSCKIGKEVSIGAYAVLGEKVSVGKNTVIYPHVTVYDQVQIGQRVVIHSGCRIGVDGFGYVQENGRHLKIPQVGPVIIEDDVALHANVCISRGTLGPTIIGAGTKVDSLTHIAHNCKIGRDCIIVSQVGVAGSVTLKDHVTVGGQAGFSDHVTVGENTLIAARAGVTKNIPANSIVSGFPAIDHREDLANLAALRRLGKKNK